MTSLRKTDLGEKQVHYIFPFSLPGIFFGTLLLSSFWRTSRGHRCRPFFPPGSGLQFLSRIGFTNPALLVDFSSSVANSRSRAFRSQFVHKKKSPRIYSSIYALGGIRTHETDLNQGRG